VLYSNCRASRRVVIFTVGIDAGMEFTKALVLKGEKDFDFIILPGGMESTAQVARRALDQVIKKAGISQQDIGFIIATGMGREQVNFAAQNLPEFLCLARGIDFLYPSARTLLDLGTRKSLVMKCNGGKALKVSAGNKCAVGTGTYLKMVANILNVSVDQMSALSLTSMANLDIQSTCAVFAESEIISLIHNGAKPEDILRGIFQGISGRIYPQLLEVGVNNDIVAVGGISRIQALIAALEQMAGCRIHVLDNPDITGALGAAIIGQKQGSSKS
jgi:predicted CoA-substrate-specific enzyme activase